jgi:lipoprotein-anchoring transpeptidase ErfK/SrfK
LVTTTRVAAGLAALVLAAGLSACGKPGAVRAAGSPAERLAKSINEAGFTPEPAAGAAAPKAGYTPAVLKLEVLLDRARFSPGVIDGRFDENLRRALAAYRQANGLKAAAGLDQALWKRLTMADPRPAVRLYAIDADDVAGPFNPVIPGDLAAMARLDQLGYASPAEEVAEAFHMDAALLEALNPGAAFRPGDTVLVADRGADDLGADVSRIEVDHAQGLVRAFGAKGALLAAYPATVGSARQAAPAGRFEVRSVAAQPNYDYQTGRVSLGGATRKAGEIAAGPNSPVGVVWIELTADCGIQGAPDPAEVGRPAARGCVRLTNWDARELARAVEPGVPVTFR